MPSDNLYTNVQRDLSWYTNLREFDVLFREHSGEEVADGWEGEGRVWLHEQLDKELLFFSLRPSGRGTHTIQPVLVVVRVWPTVLLSRVVNMYVGWSHTYSN